MNAALAHATAPRAPAPTIVAVGATMHRVLEAAEDVAETDATVLLVGESGTGKEVLARHIHARSPRAEGPWVAVNCAALPGELLEAELFGHERGAFTGAVQRHKGRIEQAEGGTLLLDEISELPLLLQAKLLRVLQEREVQRVGGSGVVPVDVRIIATSNRDLSRMVQEGSFRADLYYRIHVFPIALPPLRERREDIPALAQALLARAAERIGRAKPRLTPRALARLSDLSLPGNARELSNLLERALIRAQRRPVLDEADLDLPAEVDELAPSAPRAVVEQTCLVDEGDLDLERLERRAILTALERTGGNRTHAARLLGIGLRTLRNKLKAMREQELVVPSPAGGARLSVAGGYA